MSNTYITIVDGEYKKAKAPDVPQPWKPTMPEAEAGGGLPDPSEYTDGTVLIKVGSEWKAQAGYGWSEELEKATLPEEFAEFGYSYCKVADVPELPDGFGIGSDVTFWVWSGDENRESDHIDYAENGVFSLDVEEVPMFYIVTEDGTSAVIAEEESIAFPKKGIYFHRISLEGEIQYASGFAFGADASEKLISWDGNMGETHTIDPKFIRSVIPAAPEEDGEYVLSCTISSGEATYSWEPATAE